MPEPKRQCQTCRFFQSAQLAGNGWCTHPARQMETDVKILVRERELACRNAWGDDLWADSSSPATTSPSPEPARRTFTYLTTRLDDEVTSVIDASARQATSPAGDDIVTFTSVRPSDGLMPNPANDVNAAAVADQEERARVMARGSRDAILSARKRHVERRTQGADVAAVDSNGANGPAGEDDRVISTSSDAVVTEPSATNDAQTALPEPAISSDSVSSDVGLPRLRSFLRGEDLPANSVQAVSPTTHFDHVMRQAEQIKERSASNRIHSPESMVVAKAEPAPTTEEPPIVWDVDPAALNVAFDRVRQAIETPANLVESIAPEDDRSEIIAEAAPEHVADSTPRLALYQQPDQTTASLHHTDISANENYDEIDVDLVRLEMETDDEYADSLAYDETLIADEGPRSSLWRSFNQRLRQRFRFQAPSVHADEAYLDAEAYGDDEERFVFEADVQHLDPGFQPDEPASWYAPEPQADDWHEGQLEWEAEPQGETPIEHQGEDLGDRDMTSEESWRLDEREFPEPQPVHWHESRQQLLASLPPVEALDDSVQLVAPTPHSTPVEPIKPRRPLPDPNDFFDISEPGGLAAFRAALFGDQQRHAPVRFLEEVSAAAPAPALRHSNTSRRRPASPEALIDRPVTGSAIHSDQLPIDESNDDAELVHTETSWSEEHVSPRRGDTRRNEVLVETQVTERRTPRRQGPTVPMAAPSGDKRCETCRSFQAADDGTRGWCTNAWASTRNAMVDARELACRSSLGDWWIAADDAWTQGTPASNDHHESASSGQDRPTDHTRTSRQTPPARRVRTRNVEE